MSVLYEIRAKARDIAPPVLGACLLGYFAYHAVQGKYGVRAMYKLQQELAQAEATAADLADRRTRLERRVRLMRPGGLDPDLLEERSQAVLNFGREDSYIIFLPRDEIK